MSPDCLLCKISPPKRQYTVNVVSGGKALAMSLSEESYNRILAAGSPVPGLWARIKVFLRGLFAWAHRP